MQVSQQEVYICIKLYSIAMFLIMSPIVINVPTRGLLAVETMHAIVQWLENLNIKSNMMSMFVNKKQHYYLKLNVCVKFFWAY